MNKRKLFEIIQIGEYKGTISRTFDYFIACVIVLNIAVLFLKTFEELSPYSMVLAAIETVTLVVFIIEYLLRLYTAEFLYPEDSKPKAALKYALSFDGVVLLLTILPAFFLEGFVALRIIRVVRIFHLFRLNQNRTTDAFHAIFSVVKAKRNQILSSVVILLILMLSASLCMYGAEHDAQPENFKNAFSGIWWAMSTVFTIGYGDMYPVTTAGRILAIIIAFLGVGAVAIPTGIISAGFVEQYTKLSTDGTNKAPRTATRRILPGDKFLGLTEQDLEEQYNIFLLIAVRDGEAFLGLGSDELQVGDMIVYQIHD
ncbi:MAG: ion transporter [Lachnospiraceae bacterium]|nr:ion transporter [Lachnospiraceae bacterium]